MSDACDVVIIGGGVIGLSIAYRLAQRGQRVVVVERDRCGAGASWAAAGILSVPEPFRDDPGAVFQRRSLEIYPRFCEEVREDSGIDPQYAACGSIAVYFDEPGYRQGLSKLLPRRKRKQKAEIRNQNQEDEGSETHDHGNVERPGGAVDLDWAMLTREELRELQPGVAEDALGALHCRSTAQVRPPRLLQALRAGCARRGVNLTEGEPCKEIVVERDSVVGVRTDRRYFAVRHVVLSAGAWSSQISIAGQPVVEVRPVRGQIVLLDSVESQLTRIVEDRDCYLVPRRDGLVLVGATVEPEAGFACRNTAVGVKELMQAALHLMPVLKEASVVTFWAGLRPVTANHRPAISKRTDIEGLIVATGHYRNGIALAPATAEIVAGWVMGDVKAPNI